MIVLADNETDAREAFGKVVGPSLQMTVEELPPDQAKAVQTQLQPRVVQPYKPDRPLVATDEAEIRFGSVSAGRNASMIDPKRPPPACARLFVRVRRPSRR